MASDDEMTLAQALEEEINRRRWTQRGAADELGVDQSTIGRWIRGVQVPGLNRWDALAQFLGKTKREVADLAFRGHERLTVSARIESLEGRLDDAEAEIRRLSADLAAALQVLQAEQ